MSIATVNISDVAAIRAAGFKVEINFCLVMNNETLSFEEKKDLILGGYENHSYTNCNISELDDELVLLIIETTLQELDSEGMYHFPNPDSVSHLEKGTVAKMIELYILSECWLPEVLRPYFDKESFSFIPQTFKSYYESFLKDRSPFNNIGLNESFRDLYNEMNYKVHVRSCENSARNRVGMETLPALEIKLIYSKFESILENGVRKPKPIGFELV